MKRLIAVLLVLVLAGGVTYYFLVLNKSKSTLTKHVPENAAALFAFDALSIAQKGELSTFSGSPLWQAFKKEIRDQEVFGLFESFFRDPQSLGIDFTDKPLLFVVPHQNRMPEVGILFKVLNRDSLSKVIRQQSKDLQIQEKSGYFYLSPSAREHLLWNDEVMLVYLNAKNQIDQAEKILNGDVKPITENPYYSEIQGGDGDIQIFTKPKDLNFGSRGTVPGMVIQSYDFSTIINLSFEDGAISSESQVYFGEGGEDLEEVFKSSAKGSLLGHVAQTEPIIAVQYRFNFQALFDLIMEDESTGDVVKEFVEAIGMKPDELRNAFNGDLAFALTGIQKRKKESLFGTEDSRMETVAEMSLFIGVKDQEAVQKLIGATGLSSQSGIFQVALPLPVPFYFTTTEDGVTFSTIEEIAEKAHASGTLSDGNFEAIGNLFDANTSATFMQLDENKLPGDVRVMIQEEMRKDYAMFQIAMDPFSHLSSTSTSGSDGEARVYMRKSDVNALMQIREMGEKLLDYNQKRKAEEAEMREEFMEQLEMEGFEEEEATEEIVVPEDAVID